MSDPVKRTMFVSYFYNSKHEFGLGSSAIVVEGKMNQEAIEEIIADLKRLLNKENVTVISWQPLEV